MSETRRIPPEQLKDYFDAFTKRFLLNASPEAVDVEVLLGVEGDQYVAEGARLTGITYDPHDDALEFAIDTGDHRVEAPREVWVVEESNGFPSAIEVVRPDGVKEIVSVKPVGLRRLG